jgi:O-antigen/teichoic acid export membrane protein
VPDPAAEDATPPSGADVDGDGFGTSKQIAHGTAIRGFGEIVAKIASLAFFVMIARKLGDASFGDFIFGISFGQLLFIGAGLGTEELITREVSRRRTAVDELLPNVLAVKRLMLVLLWLVMALVVFLLGYGLSSAAAILLVGAGVAVEFQTKTFTSVFQAFEVQQYIAATLIVQRGVTAVVGVVALLLGADLVGVALVFFLGSLVGQAVAITLMRRRVVFPSTTVDRERWRGILRAGLPLGLVIVTYQVLIRLDATLLAFLTGGGDQNNSELGQYGAAYRLVDATMFISFAFGGAIYPWFSRAGDGPISVARGFSLALKAVLVILIPIGAAYTVFASDLILLLYGPGYEGAITPLRYLGAMAVLFGINGVVSVVLIAGGRPRDFLRPAVIVVIQNLIFNLATIPKYGAEAAAANAVISGALLAVLAIRRTIAPMDTIDWLSVFAAPLSGLVGFVAVGVGLSAIIPWVPALLAAGLAYAAVYLVVERLAYPGDFRFVVAVVGQARERLGWGTEQGLGD